MLTQYEIDRIRKASGLAPVVNGAIQSSLTDRIGTSNIPPPAPVETPPQDLAGRTADEMKAGVDKISSSIEQGAKDYADPNKNVFEKSAGLLKAGLGSASGAVRTIFAPVSATLKPALDKIAPDGIFAHLLDVPVKDAEGKPTGEIDTTLTDKFHQAIADHPEATKVIGDLLNVTLAGIGGGKGDILDMTKNALGDTKTAVVGGAKDLLNIPEGLKDATGKLIPESASIMDKVARLKPTDAIKFKQIAGKSQGEYLTETGNFGTPNKIIENEATKFMQSKASVDEALGQLKGKFKNGAVSDALDELIDKARSVSSDNVTSPYLNEALELKKLHDAEGLDMTQINTVKRLYERNVKLGYNKILTPDKVERATNIDNSIRTWQAQQAERLGFKNIGELNKQTQVSKFLTDKLGDQIIGKNGLNDITLTDWIILSGDSAGSISGFLAKKFFSSKGVQAKIAEILNHKDIKGMITPDITPPEAGLPQLPAPAIKAGAETKIPTPAEVIPAEKNLVTQNPKTGKFQRTYKSTGKK